MADKDNKKDEKKSVIDLSKTESDVGPDENILLSEEELLGTAPKDESKKSSKTLPKGSSKFHIPSVVQKKYPKLIKLILETESMDDEEREYWFQILPIMTNDQVDKFRDILISEKEQLAKLDAEYEEELKKINEKHLSEWQEFEAKQKREEIEKAEKKEEMEEKDIEEELLKKLQEL